MGKIATYLKEPKVSQYQKAPSFLQINVKQKFQEAWTWTFFKVEVSVLGLETALFLFFLQVHMPWF